MLSFERQPFPTPCHVDQDVAHSRAWRALGHLATFDRVLSVFHRRNHLPLPPDRCIRPMLPRASRCGQHRFAPGVHFGTDSDLCATAYIVGAAGPHSMRRATAGWIPCDFERRSTSPATEKGRGLNIRPRSASRPLQSALPIELPCHCKNYRACTTTNVVRDRALRVERSSWASPSSTPLRSYRPAPRSPEPSQSIDSPPLPRKRSLRGEGKCRIVAESIRNLPW
jgi:hypothetical protein